MRVAYVCADRGIPVFGNKGASVHVQEIIRALQRRGAEVDLFASRCEGARPRELESVKCHPLPRPAEGDASRRESGALSANAALADLLRASGPFDLVYERHALWSVAGMEYARGHGIPGLLEVNAPLIDEQALHRVLVDRASAEICASRAFAAASAILAVSREVAQYVTRFGGGARVLVVRNGVDPQRCAPGVAARLPAGPGVLTIGFTGSLKPWHGIDVLLAAFDRIHARMPLSRLLIVGDGPERSAVERYAAHTRVAGAIILTGAVSPDDVPGLLASMDVAAAPYRDQEGFYFSPLKIFEYMAAGLPTAASRVGQISEILEDDVTGVLCPPGNADALAEAVLALFDDPQRRARIGSAARRRACSAHTWDAVASRILDIARCAREPSPAGAGGPA